MRPFWKAAVVAASALALTGCGAFFMLGTGTNIVDGVDGEPGLTQAHVFSKSVTLLDADGHPVRIVPEVVRGQRYRVAVAVAWQDAGGPGEVERTWRFVRNSEIYGVDEANVDVDRSPFVFEVDAGSAHKPAGRYGYQLYVDDRMIAQVDVRVVDTPTPQATPRRVNRGW